ncbi:MAG: holo-ACP synthase [Nitrospirota bacterium]
MIYEHPEELSHNFFMIFGIGIDIVRIERIREVTEKWGTRFLQRVFTEEEIAYCYQKKSPYLSLAVRFAAKEAFIKAISSDVFVSMNEIEVRNSENGKPFLKISGRLEDFFRKKQITKAHLSMSHEHDYGIACVVLEQ